MFFLTKEIRPECHVLFTEIDENISSSLAKEHCLLLPSCQKTRSHYFFLLLKSKVLAGKGIIRFFVLGFWKGYDHSNLLNDPKTWQNTLFLDDPSISRKSLIKKTGNTHFNKVPLFEMVYIELGYRNNFAEIYSPYSHFYVLDSLPSKSFFFCNFLLTIFSFYHLPCFL